MNGLTSSTMSSRLITSRLCLSGHICQSLPGGRSLFRLQHRRLQVSGRHDSAHPTQPPVPLRVLHRPHQQETAFRVHVFPKGKDEGKDA